MQRVLSTIVLLGLLVACAAAFAITEHLKLIKSPVYATHVTKAFSPNTGKAEITFSLRKSDSVTVTIVSSGHVVATLATDQPVAKGRVTFHWDGRTAAGAVVPDGSSYQPQVELGHQTIRMPNRIRVDSTAPKVLSATAVPVLLIAGGHPIKLDYTFDGRGHAHVYLGGKTVILGRRKLPKSAVNWSGKVDGKALPPGRYVLEVAAVDHLGNETPPAERKHVAVRVEAIALDTSSTQVAAGARFAVVVHTAAATYAWSFAGDHGSGTTKSLRLRAPSKPGRYRLVVSEHGHSAGAVIVVTR